VQLSIFWPRNLILARNVIRDAGERNFEFEREVRRQKYGGRLGKKNKKKIDAAIVNPSIH
jgi:hypothetical protein